MIGRTIIRSLVAVAAVYVAIAMAAALARVPGHDIGGDAGSFQEGPIATHERELYELRTEDIVP